ncbi:hypothetical protein l13_19240 [Neisseria weaveri ATCC 51223]|nr:hypothetical protein l13_19240 [Neisseria weaveri ATCC 51223]
MVDRRLYQKALFWCRKGFSDGILYRHGFGGRLKKRRIL